MREQIISSSSQTQITDSSRIIFVRPEKWGVVHFITPLVQNEYRTVVLIEPEFLHKALREFQNSIIFFNIDKNPDGTTWYALAEQYESLLKQSRSLPVFIGKVTRDNIVSNVNLQISYDAFDMGRSPSQIYALMKALLEQWYTQGNRQYIRVNCKKESRSRFNLRYEGHPYEGCIMDISSAGMACIFDSSREPSNLRKGSVLEKIQLKLRASLVLLDGVVMGSWRSESGGNLYVVMFRNHVKTSARQKISAYVKDRIQEEFDEKLY